MGDSMRVPRIVLALLLVAPLSGCGTDAPSVPAAEPPTADTPASEPSGDPYELGSLDLPRDWASVERVLDAMPAEVAGRPRVPRIPNGTRLSYQGDGVPEVGIEVLTSRQSFAGLTEFIPWARQREAAGMEVTAQILDPAAKVSFIVGRQPAAVVGGSDDEYVVSWKAADSEFLYGVLGDTPAVRDELMRAFVEALERAG